MKEIRVSNRYAKSILALSIERDELENVRQDMALVGQVLKENNDLMLALKSPIIKSDTKKNVLHKIFADQVGEMLINFMDILVRKGREHLLFDISNEFLRQYKALKNISTVHVTTAIASDDAQRAEIMSFIERTKTSFGITGTIEINEKVNPEIMGGFIIQAGDLQIDHSVRRKFDDLRSEFSKNPYISQL